MWPASGDGGTFGLSNSLQEESGLLEATLMGIMMANQRWAGRGAGEVHLPGDARIVMIDRQGTVFVPATDTVLVEGDRLSIAGDPACIRRVREEQL